MPENQKRHFIVTPVNDFHFGWTAYVLGLSRPDEEAAGEGWDMAKETPPLLTVRFIATHRNTPINVQVVEADDIRSANSSIRDALLVLADVEEGRKEVGPEVLSDTLAIIRRVPREADDVDS